MKNIEMLSMPSLELSLNIVTIPTSKGPSNAANFPSILYIPKYSELCDLGMRIA